MSSKFKTILLWVFSFLFTLSLAVYQRMTGPTHPVRGKLEVEGHYLKYRLIRSADSDEPAKISLRNVPDGVEGNVRYKRFKVEEEWREVPMVKDSHTLTGYLPPEPPAGKLEYIVTISQKDQNYKLNETPVVIRFKGAVPALFLVPHIFFMFLAMLLSTRTGLEAILNRNRVKTLAFFTVLCLGIRWYDTGPHCAKICFRRILDRMALWWRYDGQQNACRFPFLARGLPADHEKQAGPSLGYCRRCGFAGGLYDPTQYVRF
jgi:hypothetical protein